MVFRAVGLSNYDFVQDGKRKVGTSIHVELKKDDVKGIAVDRLSIPVDNKFNGYAKSLEVPCDVELYYDRYGNVELLRKIDTSN